MEGGTLIVGLHHSCNEGLYYVISTLVIELFSFLFIGQLLSVRMEEFLDHYSIAESMGSLFGHNVRIITALSAIIRCIISITIEFHLITEVMQRFFGVESKIIIYFPIIAIILYAAFGGMTSVTFTDTVQCITFLTLIFTLIYLCIKKQSSHIFHLINTLCTNHEKFSIKKLIELVSQCQYRDTEGVSWARIIPPMAPAIMQRFYMASDVWQVRRTFSYASFFSFVIVSSMCLLGILLLILNPNIEKPISYILQTFPSYYIKSFIIIGMVALAMSTADSLLHTIAILFVHDLAPHLKFSIKNKLLWSRVTSVMIGSVSIWMISYIKKIASFIGTGHIFYEPIVTVPFIMAIFGFRPSKKSVLISMCAGMSALISYKLFGYRFPKFMQWDNSGIAYAMFINFLFLVGSHYLFPKIPNTGWIGIKRKDPLLYSKQQRSRMIRRWIYAVTTNLFWSASIIYRGYGLYILGSYFLSLFFVKSPAYYIFCLMIILWSCFFITHSFSAVCFKKKNTHSNKSIIALWNLGLCLLLFIIPAIHFIRYGYQWVHGIMLLTNILITNLLWPLSLVFVLFFCCIISASLFCTPYDLTLSYLEYMGKKSSKHHLIMQ